MNITAAILCGGKGTRLQPVIGPDLPKCLAPVPIGGAGRPFLLYVLDHLASQGVKEVVLCFRHSQISHFSSASSTEMVREPEPLAVSWSLEKEPLGTAGALRNALPLLDSDPVLVLNGDTFCPFDLKDLLESRANLVTVYGDDLKKAAGVWLIPKDFIRVGLVPLQGLLDNTGLVVPGVGYKRSGLEFVDIGTPEGYAGAEKFLREQGMIQCSSK